MLRRPCKRGVGQDRHVLDADGAERTGVRAEPFADFVRMRRADFGIASHGANLVSLS